MWNMDGFYSSNIHEIKQMKNKLGLQNKTRLQRGGIEPIMQAA